MKKDAIIKTALTSYDQESGCFITRSPLADISAHGETETEAFSEFLEAVEIEYQFYKTGKHAAYRTPGRPSKGKTRLNAEVDPDYKKQLDALRDELGGISQGEVIEYLLAYRQARPLQGT